MVEQSPDHFRILAHSGPMQRGSPAVNGINTTVLFFALLSSVHPLTSRSLTEVGFTALMRLTASAQPCMETNTTASIHCMLLRVWLLSAHPFCSLVHDCLPLVVPIPSTFSVNEHLD